VILIRDSTLSSWQHDSMNIFLDFADKTIVSIQFDEQKDQVAVEQILRVIFLDPECPSPVSK